MHADFPGLLAVVLISVDLLNMSNMVDIVKAGKFSVLIFVVAAAASFLSAS